MVLLPENCSFAEFTTNHSDFVALGSIESANQGGHRGGCISVVIEVPVPDESILEGVLGLLCPVDFKNGFVTRSVGDATGVRRACAEGEVGIPISLTCDNLIPRQAAVALLDCEVVELGIASFGIGCSDTCIEVTCHIGGTGDESGGGIESQSA